VEALTPFLLTVIASLLAWYGVRIERLLSTIIRLHLGRHPEDAPAFFKVGGTE